MTKERPKTSLACRCVIVCCGLITIASLALAIFISVGIFLEFRELKTRVITIEKDHLLVRKTDQESKGNNGLQRPRGSNGTTTEKDKQETLTTAAGSVMTSESIHLVGDEKKFPLKAFDHKVKSWKVDHKQGTIDYLDKDGAIVIDVPGTYYIYCQMHYYNEKEHLTGHITYINNRKILESIVGISNGSLSKHFTKQHGGLFRVDRNDRIQVRLPFSHNSYEFTKISSYFGAFRVGP